MVLTIFLGNSNRKVHGGLGFIRSHTSVRVARWGAECAGEAWLGKWCLHGIGEWNWELEGEWRHLAKVNLKQTSRLVMKLDDIISTVKNSSHGRSPHSFFWRNKNTNNFPLRGWEGVSPTVYSLNFWKQICLLWALRGGGVANYPVTLILIPSLVLSTFPQPVIQSHPVQFT